MENIRDAARIGRYMIRCPLVLERLQWDEDAGEVVYAARPTRAAGAFGGVGAGMFWNLFCGGRPSESSPATSDSFEGAPKRTIARVTDHIPEPGQQLIRNWGYYSNASRGKRRRRRLTWAKLIQKVYEIDPLLCPFCGEQMKIISFITEYPVIKKILTHIDFDSQQPEPLAHSPPLFQDTVYVPF